MAISISCPACGRQHNVKDEAAGKRFKCKECETVISVPEAGAISGGGQSDEFGGASNPFGGDDPFGNEDFGEAAAGSTPMPQRRSASDQTGSRSIAKDRLSGPAVGLMITGAISILGALALMALFAIVAIAPQPPGQNMGQAEMIMGVVFWIVILFVQIVVSSLVVFGAVKMKKCESYGLAMTACIVASIPCFTPCICMPFGIWGLVVLMDDSVKAAFR